MRRTTTTGRRGSREAGGRIAAGEAKRVYPKASGEKAPGGGAPRRALRATPEGSRRKQLFRSSSRGRESARKIAILQAAAECGASAPRGRRDRDHRRKEKCGEKTSARRFPFARRAPRQRRARVPVEPLPARLHTA